MTLPQRKSLAKRLRQGPPNNESGLWTTKEVRAFIREKYGVEYAHSHTWLILKAAGFSLQKPRNRHYTAATPQARMILKKAARLARNHRRKGFVVACQDEATFGLIPILSRGWAQKGSRPVAHMNFRQDSISVMGARSQRAFVFSFCKRKTKRRFVRFLRQLQKR